MSAASGRTMRLTRLRVEQFRRFRGSFELAGFEPGLNIFCGPNEAGKSSLVRAIRAAFFERHRSSVVEDLRPWGDAAAAPTIELDFELGAQSCRLVKSFLAKKRCNLELGHPRARLLEGVEAEDHLAQLFGFGFAAKGPSKDEHWGVPGLLWVEQGSGQVLDVSVGHARDHLHGALTGRPADDAGAGGAAGALAASGGDELLDRLRARRAMLLTPAGKPREEFSRAITQAAELEQRLEQLDTQIAEVAHQVDTLAELRLRHDAVAAQRPWEALRLELQQVETRRQALAAADAQLAADKVRLAQIEQTRQSLLEQLQTQDQQALAVVERRQRHAQASDQMEQALATLMQSRPQVELAQRRCLAAREALRLARQAAHRAGLQAQCADAEPAAKALAQAVARAEQAQHELIALRAAAVVVQISPTTLEALRRLERQSQQARWQREAVATRLQFSLEPGLTLTLTDAAGSHALQGQGEQLLDAPATLVVAGLGQLTITPGGADLAELARRQDEAAAALQQALQAAGAVDLAAAEARAARGAELQNHLGLAEQALSLVAPQGLEALRAQSLQAAERCQTLRQALSEAPAADSAGQAAGAPGLNQAELEQEAAAAAERLAQERLAAALRQHDSVRERLSEAARELAAAEALANDPERRKRQSQAREQALLAAAERDALAARIETAAAELRLARPDIVAQDIERLARSADQLERSHQLSREEILLLENTLQQAGALGLDEQREVLAGESLRAVRRRQELHARADALDLLCQRIEARRQAALNRLQAPLQARLQHYLGLLLPGAQLHLADDLLPTRLSRSGLNGAPETGEIDQLSFGAREQLGLLSRLAYADLLREAGRPTLIILDDALVHSDSARLAMMKRVLFDAAQRHQMLLFTCHPEHWGDMGTALRALR